MNELVKRLMPLQETDSQEELLTKLREVMQSLALMGLWRAKFFNHAAFYGGTALRILYGLNRFSEDLDFSLLTSNPQFSFQQYKSALENEFNAMGFKVKLESKEKSDSSTIESAFLKANTLQHLILLEVPEKLLSSIQANATLKIKLEVDTRPPMGFATEMKYIFSPFQFAIRVFTLPSLFAGKMHAVLCRKWKNRVKGRDWYDFAWYVSHYPDLNLYHLEQRMRDSGHYAGGEPLTKNRFLELLDNSIDSLDIDSAKNEVLPFLSDIRELKIWSKEFFKEAGNRIVFV